jgi:anti-sigma factor RsiW
MTETQEKTPDVHEVVLLLPWYLNGTLAEGERLEVERHLSNCPECRRELESLSGVRTQTREMLAAVPGPSGRAREAVMQQIRRSKAAAPQGPGRAGEPGLPERQPGFQDRPPSWFERFTGAFGVLFRPQWAPALAVLLIVGQFGALAWLAQGPATQSGLPGAQTGVQSRGVGAAPIRLKIVFGSSATVRDIAAAIHDLGGRIVDGPTPEGAFVIELPPASPQETSSRLRALRERPGLVESIENATP